MNESVFLDSGGTNLPTYLAAPEHAHTKKHGGGDTPVNQLSEMTGGVTISVFTIGQVGLGPSTPVDNCSINVYSKFD